MPRIRLPYRADWDGLRGIAILLVLACHTEILFWGGFIGVDLFFVLSGFLITRLILNDLEQGSFSPTHFWERRLRRIFPALAVVLIATLALGQRFLASDAYGDLGWSALSVVGMVASIHFWRDTGYFSDAAEFKPLLHTWSLANEEQFYLICMVFLPWLVRHLGRKRTFWVFGFLTGASFVASVVLVGRNPQAGYFLLPSRFWEMGAGCLLAWAPEARLPRWARETLGAIGLSTLALAAYHMDAQTAFPGWAALPVVLATVALLWPTPENARISLTHRFLSFPPLVFLGKISYPLYLWHWPLLVFLNIATFDSPTTEAKLQVVGVALLLSIATYGLIETPIRGRWVIGGTRPFLVASALSTALVVATALGVVREASSQAEVTLGQETVVATSNRLEKYLPSHPGGDEPFDQWPRFGEESATPEFVLWGDSHAMSWLPALEAQCKRHGTSLMAVTRFMTPPIVGFEPTQWDQFNEKVLAYLETRPAPVVILAGHWSGYLTSEQTDQLLLNTIDRLLDLGYRVHFVKDVPEFPYHVPRIMKLNASRKFALERLALTRADYERINAHHDRILPQLRERGVGIIDPLEFFQASQDPNLLLPFDKQGVLYRDADHLSVYGSLSMREVFDPIFQELTARRQEQPSDRDTRNGIVNTESQ